jgi:hypothetical protein
MNFRTDLEKHRYKARDVAIFDEKLPRKLNSISIDDELLDFSDPTVIPKFIKTMKIIEYLRKKRKNIDCLGFVALYKELINPSDIPKRSKNWLKYEVGPEEVQTSDIEPKDIILFASSFYDMEDRPFHRHAVVVEESEGELLCLQVLGDGGPFAISSIEAAQETFGAYVNLPVINISKI